MFVINTKNFSNAAKARHKFTMHASRRQMWRQQLPRTQKIIVLFTTFFILPILATSARAENSNRQAIAFQNNTPEQAGITHPPEMAFVPRRQVPLNLVLETGAGILLLCGLIAAYLANRTQMPLTTATKPQNTTSSKTNNLALAPRSTTPLLPNTTEPIQDEIAQAELIKEVTLQLQKAFDAEDLYKTAVKAIRRAIRSDRVVIYQLDTNTWQGNIVAESVAPGLPQTLHVKISDPCLHDRHVELYQQGHVRAINDIYHEPELTDCYIKLLEQFAVKANLVAPIVQNDVLFGLLIAHQCDRPRIWQQNEISLFSRLATQVGFAINQIDLT
ncbi:GAF domain-containing protein [Chroococcidiopsis sp. TS-821]|uniref:GAF domain-containing protein n=2 Tax=Chroococcidiopsis sp. TS-821 TaxID=1378066 RepID=UPI00143DC487|nr:GAF domain-containing protein [Chroococcidiopsis sp. TS-821]